MHGLGAANAKIDRGNTAAGSYAFEFAGADEAATERARSYFTGYRPSSPSIALMQKGKVVHMLERSQIENRDAQAIAAELTAAFDKFCAKTPAGANA